MEQVQTGVLAMMQAIAVPQVGAGSDKGSGQTGSSEFRKLLEKQTQGSQPEARKEPAKTEAPKAETPETAATKSEAAGKPSQNAPVKNQQQQDAATQERMMLAAMQTVQLPVDTVEVPTESQGELVAAVTPEFLLTPEQSSGQTAQADPQGNGLLEAMPDQAAAEAQPEGQLISDVVSPEAGPEVQTQPQQAQPHTEAPVVEAPRTNAVPEAEAVEVSEDDGTEPLLEEAPAEPQPLFHDVEAAPIKVSESTAPQESSPAGNVEQQVTNGLTQALQQGESRVQIELTPDSLGNVRVEIVHTADGGIHVALSAENSQTRSLLERHADNLQSILGSQTQGQVQVEVQKPQESQQNQQQQENPYDGHNGNNGQPQQEQQQRRQNRGNTEDFLHQLRLGLIPAEVE